MNAGDQPAYPQSVLISVQGNGQHNYATRGGLTAREVIAKDLLAALIIAGRTHSKSLVNEALILTEDLLSAVDKPAYRGP